MATRSGEELRSDLDRALRRARCDPPLRGRSEDRPRPQEVKPDIDDVLTRKLDLWKADPHPWNFWEWRSKTGRSKAACASRTSAPA
eukprot:1855591-Pyramimonas_sp.AAC.1